MVRGAHSYYGGRGGESGWTLARRTRSDWAGVSMGDAFNPTVSSSVRLEAQSRLYAAVFAAQERAASCAKPDEGAYEPAVPAQLGPLFTGYPRVLAAHACIGLSAYLEFVERLPRPALWAAIEAGHRVWDVEPPLAPGALAAITKAVSRAVETRLHLRALGLRPGLASVDMYRLFIASQVKAAFRTVPEIVTAVVLLADVVPLRVALALHPVTDALVEAVERASAPRARALAGLSVGDEVAFGLSWVADICRALAPLLEQVPGSPDIARGGARSGARGGAVGEPRGGTRSLLEGLAGRGALPGDGARDESRDESSEQAERLEADEPGSPRFAPLNEPPPPTLTDPPSLAVRLLLSSGREGPLPLDLLRLLKALDSACATASGSGHAWDDLRDELMSELLVAGAFGSGPVEGSPSQGRRVRSRLDGRSLEADVFEHALPPSRDARRIADLERRSRPVVEALRPLVFPGRTERPTWDRLRTGGTLDPTRLVLHRVSDAVHRRTGPPAAPSRRGDPVVLIICDGSGSMRPDRMDMMAVLTHAWATVASGSNLRVAAGIYRDGRVPGRGSQAIVDWIHHPSKTVGMTPSELSAAVAATPRQGRGDQSDALCIEYMVEQVTDLRRGGDLYVTLIGDCGWCPSWRGSGLVPRQEVAHTLRALRARMRAALHLTLVALARSPAPVVAAEFDHVLHVPDVELRDPGRVAGRIGGYVASVMRDRRAGRRTDGESGRRVGR